MVAGTLAKAGYFMGDHFSDPNPSNAKGFFEDHKVNYLNEDLLGPVVPGRPSLLGRWFFKDRPVFGQRWMACIPPQATLPEPTADVTARMQERLAHQPYCFKDPRFSYTLPLWEPHLNDTVYICVFRHPGETANSMVKECHTAPYMQSLNMDYNKALQVWEAMCNRILTMADQGGTWLFLHMQQVFTPEGLDRIATFTEAEVDRSFPEPELKHSKTDQPTSPNIEDTYQELCHKAHFSN